MIKVLIELNEETMQSDKLFLQTYDDHLRKFLSIVEKFKQVITIPLTQTLTSQLELFVVI